MGSERDRALVRAAIATVYPEDTADDEADAIIAAVDAQHPAPALPREVAMRIADAVRFLGLEQMHSPPSDDDLAAIVSRHLPTDEEREAERAVVEAALAMRAAWTESPISAYDRKRDTMHAMADRLLAIRAKRGAR